jgi:hypothetical protein
MASYDEIRYLRSKAHSLCHGLKLRLSEFDDDFPAGSPGELIRITTEFLARIRDEVEATVDKNILTAFFRLIDTLASTLDLLDNAHTAQTPRGLVQFLEEIANSLYPGSSLLVSPSSTYNYSIINIIPAFSKLAEDSLPASAATSLTSTFPKALYVVRFPRTERDNVLNHTVFGHEFGHPIADDFIAAHEQQASFASRLGSATQKIQAEPTLLGLLNKAADAVERSQLLNQFVDTVVTIHRRGLQELVSDAVGVKLFSVSALLSSMDVFGQASLDSAPRRPLYYPPPRYRLRLMHQALESEQQLSNLERLQIPAHLVGVQESTRGVLAQLARIVSEDHDKTEISKNAIAKIAYEWLEETLPEAFQFASDRLKDMRYTPIFDDGNFVALIERLALHVPPNEVGTWPKVETIDWRSGLLASWLVAISKSVDVDGTPATRLKELQTVHKLALKGVEYGVIQKQCDAHLTKQAAQS